MNSTRLFLLSVGLTMAAAPSLAQSAERLVSPVLAGFVTAHSAANRDQAILEEIPKGDTLANWTRMVTTQRFNGLASKATAAQYAANIIAAVPARCRGARISPVARNEVSGREAARFRLDCPSGTGGRPETFILLAIAGSPDMHVKQVAFRGGLRAADLAWANRFLDATAVCRPTDVVAPCR